MHADFEGFEGVTDEESDYIGDSRVEELFVEEKGSEGLGLLHKL